MEELKINQVIESESNSIDDVILIEENEECQLDYLSQESKIEEIQPINNLIKSGFVPIGENYGTIDEMTMMINKIKQSTIHDKLNVRFKQISREEFSSLSEISTIIVKNAVSKDIVIKEIEFEPIPGIINDDIKHELKKMLIGTYFDDYNLKLPFKNDYSRCFLTCTMTPCFIVEIKERIFVVFNDIKMQPNYRHFDQYLMNKMTNKLLNDCLEIDNEMDYQWLIDTVNESICAVELFKYNYSNHLIEWFNSVIEMFIINCLNNFKQLKDILDLFYKINLSFNNDDKSIAMWVRQDQSFIFIIYLTTTIEVVKYLSHRANNFKLNQLIKQLESIKFKPIVEYRRSQVSEHESIGLLFKLDQVNEINATLDAMSTNLQTRHNCTIELYEGVGDHEVDEQFKLKNCKLEIAESDGVSKLVLQPIEIAIFNYLNFADRFTAKNEIVDILNELTDTELVSYVKDVRQLLTLMHVSDYYQTDFCDEVKFGKLMDLVNKINSSGLIESIKTDRNPEEIVNQIISSLKNLLNKSNINICFKVNFNYCSVTMDESAIKNAFNDKTFMNDQNINIKKFNSHVQININFRQFIKDLNTIRVIGTQPNSLKKISRVNQSKAPSTILLSSSERARLIESKRKEWCKRECFRFTERGVDKTFYGKIGSVLVDNRSIPVEIFNFNCFVAMTLIAQNLNEDLLGQLNTTLRVECTFDVDEDITLISENRWELMTDPATMERFALFHYGGFGCILPIDKFSKKKSKPSIWRHLSSMKGSFSENYELTDRATFKLNDAQLTIRFLYNSDFSPINCLIPREDVDYFKLVGDGRTFKVNKKEQHDHEKFQKCNILIEDSTFGKKTFVKEGDKLLETRVYDCYGEYVRIDWLEEMQLMNNIEINQLCIFILNELMGNKRSINTTIQFSSGKMFPSEIKHTDQIMPIIVAMRSADMYYYNLNPCWDADFYIEENSKTKFTGPIQIILNPDPDFIAPDEQFQIDYFKEFDEDDLVSLFNIAIKDSSNYYALKEDVNIKIRSHSDSYIDLNKRQLILEIIEKQSNEIKQFNPTISEFMTYSKRVYLQQLNLAKFNSRIYILEDCEIQIDTWYTMKLWLNKFNENLPMVRCSDGKNGFGKIQTSINLVKIDPGKFDEEMFKWEIKGDRFVIPKFILKKVQGLDMSMIEGEKNWYKYSHSFIETLLVKVLQNKGFNARFEFKSKGGLERDILVDNSVIIEVKTRSSYDDAIDSFNEFGKHTGEYLIACTRNGTYVSSFVFEKYLKGDSETAKFIAASASSFFKFRDEHKQAKINMLSNSCFPISIGKVRDYESLMVIDNLIEVNKGDELPVYTKLLREKFSIDKKSNQIEPGHESELMVGLEQFEKETIDLNLTVKDYMMTKLILDNMYQEYKSIVFEKEELIYKLQRLQEETEKLKITQKPDDKKLKFKLNEIRKTSEIVEKIQTKEKMLINESIDTNKRLEMLYDKAQDLELELVQKIEDFQDKMTIMKDKEGREFEFKLIMKQRGQFEDLDSYYEVEQFVTDHYAKIIPENIDKLIKEETKSIEHFSSSFDLKLATRASIEVDQSGNSNDAYSIVSANEISRQREVMSEFNHFNNFDFDLNYSTEDGMKFKIIISSWSSTPIETDGPKSGIRQTHRRIQLQINESIIVFGAYVEPMTELIGNPTGPNSIEMTMISILITNFNKAGVKSLEKTISSLLGETQFELISVKVIEIKQLSSFAIIDKKLIKDYMKTMENISSLAGGKLRTINNSFGYKRFKLTNLEPELKKDIMKTMTRIRKNICPMTSTNFNLTSKLSLCMFNQLFDITSQSLSDETSIFRFVTTSTNSSSHLNSIEFKRDVKSQYLTRSSEKIDWKLQTLLLADDDESIINYRIFGSEQISVVKNSMKNIKRNPIEAKTKIEIDCFCDLMQFC